MKIIDGWRIVITKNGLIQTDDFGDFIRTISIISTDYDFLLHN